MNKINVNPFINKKILKFITINLIISFVNIEFNDFQGGNKRCHKNVR